MEVFAQMYLYEDVWANIDGPLLFTCFGDHRKCGVWWAIMSRFQEPARSEWRILNYIHYKVWDKITHPFPNFNCAAVEFWECISSHDIEMSLAAISHRSWYVKQVLDLRTGPYGNRHPGSLVQIGQWSLLESCKWFSWNIRRNFEDAL